MSEDLDEGYYACKNLKLSIRHEPDFKEGKLRVRLTLQEEPPGMREVELCYEINQSESHSSRRYHVQEAMVIGMRRLIGSAIEQELIKIRVSGSLGALATSRKKDTDSSTLLEL